MGSYRSYSISGETANLVPEFAMEDLPLAELQPWFLWLQRRTCPWAELSDDHDDNIKYCSAIVFFFFAREFRRSR